MATRTKFDTQRILQRLSIAIAFTLPLMQSPCTARQSHSVDVADYVHRLDADSRLIARFPFSKDKTEPATDSKKETKPEDKKSAGEKSGEVKKGDESKKDASTQDAEKKPPESDAKNTDSGKKESEKSAKDKPEKGKPEKGKESAKPKPQPKNKKKVNAKEAPEVNSSLSPSQPAPVFTADAALISVIKDLVRSLKDTGELAKVEDPSQKVVVDLAQQILERAVQSPSLESDRIVRGDKSAMSAEAWASGDVALPEGGHGSLAVAWAKHENGLFNVTIAGNCPNTPTPSGKKVGEFLVILQGKATVQSGFDIQSQANVSFWLGKLSAIMVEADCCNAAPDSKTGDEKSKAAGDSEPQKEVKKNAILVLQALLTERGRQHLERLSAHSVDHSGARQLLASMPSSPSLKAIENAATEKTPAANAQAESKISPKTELKTDQSTEAKVEAKAEPKAEPRLEVKTEPKVEEAKAEPKPEPKAEPKIEAKAEPKPESKAEPKVEAKADKTDAKLDNRVAEKLDAKPNPAPETNTKTLIQLVAAGNKSQPYSVSAPSTAKTENEPEPVDSSSAPSWNRTVDERTAINRGVVKAPAPESKATNTAPPTVASLPPDQVKQSTSPTASTMGWESPAPETSTKLASSGASVLMPARAIAGQFLTASVVDYNRNAEASVELSFNGAALLTDGKGQAIFMVPEDATPGHSLHIALASRPDLPPGTVNILQPLTIPDHQEVPKIDRVNAMVSPGNIIQVDGHNFDGQAEHNRVLVDGAMECKVTAASPVQLKALLPDNVQPGAHNLSVTISGLKSNATAFSAIAAEVKPDPREAGKDTMTRLIIRVIGTDNRVNVHIKNQTPDVIKLLKGPEFTLTSPGGVNNSFVVGAQRLKKGGYRVDAFVE